jgi:hypothetical protein
MATLRKSFCKNWWNDQWRALLCAFVEFLSEGSPEIRLPLSRTAVAILEANLMTFEAPISIVGDGPAPTEEESIESETAADEFDSGEDIGELNDLDEVVEP